MKILVTGAKGFVGKNLCWALKNIQNGKDRTTHPGPTEGQHFNIESRSGISAPGTGSRWSPEPSAWEAVQPNGR